MKQIKFRAWNAEENNMIFTFDGNYEIMVNSEDGTVFCGGHMSNGDWTEPVLMQFTGLLDENGNEIYEGDILQYHFEDDGAIIAENLEIFWNQSTASFCYDDSYKGDKTSGQELSVEFCRDVVIIGNVYQNRDLLQK